MHALSGVRDTTIDFLIVDEAHFVKNPGAKRSKLVDVLSSNSKRVVLMTGTPLENKVEEFVNLIRICNVDLSRKVGSVSSSAIESYDQVSHFEKQIAPVYLRRNQVDVLHELPEVVETEEWVELSQADWQNYDRSVVEGHIMGLRQAANGNSLASAKMARLKDLIDQYRSENKKMVIFSFFKNALGLAGQIIGDHLRIDGSVPANQRMEIVDTFNKSSEWQALVSQIDAGGVGLNLQTASVVILIEPQFKPTTEWQAIKRVHRMGQTQRVMVHRLISTDTVDERMRDLVEQKTVVFDDYARESSVKSASSAATDSSEQGMKKRILELETERFKQRQMAG